MFEDESSNDLQEEDACCDECGMVEGHSSDCSNMNLGEDDAMPSPGNKDSKNMTKKLRSYYTKLDGKSQEEQVCPECNAPAGKPHAQDCLLDEADNALGKTKKLSEFFGPFKKKPQEQPKPFFIQIHSPELQGRIASQSGSKDLANRMARGYVAQIKYGFKNPNLVSISDDYAMKYQVEKPADAQALKMALHDVRRELMQRGDMKDWKVMSSRLDEVYSIKESDSNDRLGADECPECGNRDNLYVELNGNCYCEECDSSWNVDSERPELDHEDIMTSRSEDGEYHEDSDHDDDEYFEDDVEVCPGCGIRVGFGINDECDDPMGCGYWKDFGGQANLDPKQPEAFTKRQNWNENCDYDGLALNESSMFNRFDTLVGQRRDGSFDYRVNETTKLRALVKKVVSEIKEMKLSVSGPIFGSTPSDNNDDQDDDVSKVSKSKKSKTKPKSKSKS